MPKFSTKERTLIIIKPDALQRSLLGEIVSRFEKKGLKIVAMKMIKLSNALAARHYHEHKDKPFFDGLKRFMQTAPVTVIVLEGLDAVKVVRSLLGPTSGRVAPAATIRGDFSMSGQANVVHASDSVKTAKEEIKRFFKSSEIFNYKKIDYEFVYAADERA